ncbi:hypothetical protein QQS21_007192 [Conoideocrella luteorostrata]|uniref:Alpha/beta hydrolase fold-3 domain-containing protein n=1 Tax=Conoideocrella luteorostrata TaxID=1105319 RepID=A0AAJ0FSQ1_9HYPO|nr:hypothetical protein QQS21_007192 [Conoideocrella luteorostrata]
MASSLFAAQPLKAIFIVIFFAKLPIELTFVAFKYLFKPLRPQPAWSWSRCLLVYITKLSFQLFAGARLQRAVYNEPASAKERYAQIEKPAASVVAAIPGALDIVKPSPQEAVWFPSPPPKPSDPAGEKRRIFLYFPGGAYVVAFGHKSIGHDVHRVFEKHLKATRTVWAQYRLSDGSEGLRFPAALQDAVTFYSYVLSLGFKAHDIILTGDSAGGNLVLALIRYLESIQDKGQALPLPRSAMIFSPWVSISENAGGDYSKSLNSQSDLLWSPLLQWGADCYRPQGQLSREVEAYISPLHHPFKLSIPLAIQDGALEAFHANIKEFAQEMKALNGDRLVQFQSVPLCPHDPLLVYKGFGLEQEFGEALGLLCNFLDA